MEIKRPIQMGGGDFSVPTCDECNQSVQRAIRLGIKPGWECSPTTLCIDCLNKALRMMYEESSIMKYDAGVLAKRLQAYNAMVDGTEQETLEMEKQLEGLTVADLPRCREKP